MAILRVRCLSVMGFLVQHALQDLDPRFGGLLEDSDSVEVDIV